MEVISLNNIALRWSAEVGIILYYRHIAPLEQGGVLKISDISCQQHTTYVDKVSIRITIFS